MVPSLHLAHNMLSVATASTVTTEDEVVTKRHEVYLYSCAQGELEEILVCLVDMYG